MWRNFIDNVSKQINTLWILNLKKSIFNIFIMLRKKLKLSNVEEQNDKLSNNVSSNEIQTNAISTTLANEGTSHGSKYQSNYFAAPPLIDASVSVKMIDIQRNLNEILDNMNFVKNPICYVYNPTVYANEPYEKYLKLYCNKQKKIIFMGMNPGPWGMCQTGIPFGEVNMVKNWLHLDGYVGQPSKICKNRKINGFDCTRKEISGDLFWNFLKNLCDTPQSFFNNCFVYNYCPIALMKENGGNITPADMEITLRNSLQEACDKAFIEVISALKPEIIIGIGRYAEARALSIVKLSQQDIKVLYMPHPSQRTPNNKDWPEKASKFINENNLIQFFK